MNLETSKQKYPNIPANTVEDLCEYVNRGRPVGGFLQAVLCRDLFEAVNLADNNNRLALVDLVKLIFNDVPLMCYGKIEKVNEWISKRGIEQWNT